VESTRAEWLAATAHELRTPLAALRAEVEAAQDGIRPFTRETLDRLHAQLLRLGRLVDDLRLVTQESYGAAAVRRAIEPLTLFADAAEANALRFDEMGLQLEGVQALRGLQGRVRPLVLGDRQRLEQVAVNLLENSLRYTHRGGRVRLQGEVRGEQLAITLEDSAPAPRDADYPRLFDRFFRGDASRSRELGGSGLGLAICRGIVQAHGGTIEASPSPLGGLRIVITLPLVQA
jgi:two-component system sensor histidine kinase BaeS